MNRPVPAKAATAPRLADFALLLKPNVMSLVVFTAFVGLALAPGRIDPVTAITAIACIAFGAGAAGAINMWYDRDIDAFMARTAARPIPAGRMDARVALGYGLILAVLSVWTMAERVNLAAAVLLAATLLYYVFIYTVWLKRRTPHNIVIGGASGALPPMIGWAAVTGDVSWQSFSLFLIIFLWTPPHSWALALFRCDDYTRAGVPMLPVVAGERATRRGILAYSLLLVPASLAPWALGVSGIVYALGAAALGAGFLWRAWATWKDDGDKAAKRLFGFSILYLFLLFVLLLGDALLTRVLSAL